MTKEEKAQELIKLFEGCRFRAYKDCKGIPTIGFGTTCYPNGKKVELGDIIDFTQAKQYLLDYLNKYVFPLVNKISDGIIIKDNIFAALCSIIYNVGESHINVVSFRNALSDKEKLASLFRQYNKITINGVKQPFAALSLRREAEIKYFMDDTCV